MKKLILQGIILGFALFVILIGIRQRKFSNGLLEWIFLISAFMILVDWVINIGR